MDFEKLIDSIESLLYSIIVEITLVVITIGKLFTRSKNCYTIVEAEEALENREDRYRRYSSPIKLGVLLSLATLVMINTSNDLDEAEVDASTASVEAVQPETNDAAMSDSTYDATASSGTESAGNTNISNDSVTVNTDLSITDHVKDSVANEESRIYNLLDQALVSFTKLKLYEQASIFFFVCNLNAIVIGLLLFRIRREPIPGKVFRTTFLSMVYARTYLTFPFLLMIAVIMLSPTTAFEADASGSSVYIIGLLIAMLLFIFGFYKYIRGALYIVKSVLSGASFLMMTGFFVLLILLDYWWISFVIDLFRS